MDPKRSLRGGPVPLQSKGPLKPGAPAAGILRPGASGPGQQPARPSFGEALDQLSRDVQQLRIDFERFFSGALPLPPEELRNRVQVQIRHLRNSTLVAAADNFRLGDLEARFNTYNELFNRRLRDREEGRHPGPRQAPPPAPRRFNLAQGIVFGDRIDSEGAEALYQGLAASPGDAPRFDLDSFQTYLARQVTAIREKTGCDEVQFRLASEDGKMKLKARPVAARKGA